VRAAQPRIEREGPLQRDADEDRGEAADDEQDERRVDDENRVGEERIANRRR
jgi:hypothetical protein